jgi:hypothetical protein
VPRLSYQAIADKLGKTERQVYVALNPERKRKNDRASDHRNRNEITRRELERRRATAPPCERCGKNLSSKYTLGGLCRECLVDQRRERERAVIRLWRADASPSEIDELFGWRSGSAAAIASRLRKRGVKLAKRPPTDWRRRRNAAGKKPGER